VSLRELQEALARALTDPSLRTEAPALPPSLSGVPTARLRAFAGVLEAKRGQRVQDALPVSCRLLGDRFPMLFATYAAAHPPTEAARRAEVAAFVAHAAAALRPEAIVAPGISGPAAAELVRYEAIRHHLRRQTPPIPVSPDVMKDERLLGLRPVLGPAVVAASFDDGVDCWLESLGTDPRATPPQAGPVNLLLARFAHPPLVRTRRVNAATVALLACCDGSMPLRQAIDGLAWELGTGDEEGRTALRVESLGLLRLLCGQGYLDWA
jgi:hypothetical protein